MGRDSVAAMPMLFTVWTETVRQDPGAPALVEGASGKIWSRAALAAEAEAWCGRHPDATAVRGHRVLLAEENGVGWWRGFLGIMLAGGVPVPIDPEEPAERVREIAEQVGAAGTWRLGVWGPAEGRPVRSGAGVALIKLTSGSTGAPRALVCSHDQMLADGRQVCGGMGVGPGDLNLAVIPLGHSYGLGSLVMPLLAQGTPLLCASSPLPQALAADCRRHRPTVFPAVPPLLRALVRAEVAPADLASLRLVISAGAPLAAQTAAEFAARFGVAVHGFYGTSETGGISYDRTGEATLAGRSLGTPLPGVTVRGGRGHRLQVTSAAVTGRGTYCPQDRIAINELGELVLLGRRGRMVKIGGRRVSLGEIERALESLPGVQSVHVAVNPGRADTLAAAVAGEVEAGALRAALRQRLPAWKVPDRLLILPQFPVTARGKTDTRKVQALLADGTVRPGPQGSMPKSK